MLPSDALIALANTPKAQPKMSFHYSFCSSADSLSALECAALPIHI